MLRIVSCIALFWGISLAAGAQETQEKIDPRLVKNRGKQAEASFVHNKNAYHFFLFELDKSHFTTTLSKLTREEKKRIVPASGFFNEKGEELTPEAVNSPDFNFYDYGIRLKSDTRTFVALDKKTVLVFYSNKEVAQQFAASEYNVK